MADRDLTPPDAVIVLFGGNGDLARRKLIPSLWDLHRAGLMPEQWVLIGASRSDMADEAYGEFAREALLEFDREVSADDEDAFTEFASHLRYRGGGFDADDPSRIADAVAEAEQEMGGEPTRLFYLAVPPSAFGPITEGIGAAGLDQRARVVFEKPFGTDAESFAELDDTVRSVLTEEQIYRIDHFLGKETLQNVLALRFANGMFEPVWNRQHIDHIQIDSPESIDIGSRASFYESTGALRDMVVTHLFQVLSIIALEPPVSLDPSPLMDEKRKVFESMSTLRCEDVVFGQYEGYTESEGVAADSTTETFVAARIEIDNWRWAGVPIYLRTGKAMAEKRQTMTLAFKRPPRQMFAAHGLRADAHDHLTLDMAGDQGVTVSFLAKRPGPRLRLGQASMRFSYEQDFGATGGVQLDAYERLLHDALLGDRTLFTRADGIGRTWELVKPILERPPRVLPYARGSWGPEAATELIAPRTWHLPEDHEH